MHSSSLRLTPSLIAWCTTFAATMLFGAVYAQPSDPDRSLPDREPSAGCGTFDYRYDRMAAGPADYRGATDYLIRLVENAHFTREVETLTRGKSSTIGGDIGYTLRVFPNHARALRAAAAYERLRGPEAVKEMGFSVQCFFDRAVSFRASDPNVRIVVANELIKRGQTAEARDHLIVAEQYSNENAAVFYNLGLLYFDLGDYDRSMAFAMKAYGLGLDLPGLRQKLTKAGKWKD